MGATRWLGGVVVLVALLCNTVKMRRVLTMLKEEVDKGVDHHVFNDEGCSVLHHDTADIGFEDIAWIDRRWALMSSDDRYQLWQTLAGAKTTPNGQIVLFDNDKAMLSPLVLHGFPEDIAFHPHGIFIKTNQKGGGSKAELFVINHAYFKGGERIEVFDVRKSVHEETSEQTVSLQWKYRIDPPIFQTEAMGNLNDLVVVSPSEFFVTRYLNLPDSVEGRMHSSIKVKILNHPFICFFPPLHKTVVYYCRFSPLAEDVGAAHTECQVAAGDFAMANGITVSDKGKIFVVDLTMKSIWACSHNKTDNTLNKEVEIRLPTAVDNAEFDTESGKIYMGALTNLLSEKDCGGALEMQAVEPYQVVNLMQSKKLGQVSSAARRGSTLLIGSPKDRGLLYCPNQF